jgi:hypothetical protein
LNERIRVTSLLNSVGEAVIIVIGVGVVPCAITVGVDGLGRVLWEGIKPVVYTVTVAIRVKLITDRITVQVIVEWRDVDVGGDAWVVGETGELIAIVEAIIIVIVVLIRVSTAVAIMIGRGVAHIRRTVSVDVDEVGATAVRTVEDTVIIIITVYAIITVTIVIRVGGLDLVVELCVGVTCACGLVIVAEAIAVSVIITGVTDGVVVVIKLILVGGELTVVCAIEDGVIVRVRVERIG